MKEFLAHYFEHLRIRLEYSRTILYALGIVIICTRITSCAPTTTPLVQLPGSDDVIFTIQNSEPWSGREGDPRPNWLGWGAETFTTSPDGSVWIADTAVDPNRLLHFSFQGELLQEISLQDLVVYPYDLVATQDALWVLDISSQPPRVVHLDTDGRLLFSVDIPKEMMTYDGEYVSNGVFNLLTGENNEILLSGVNGLYELLNASGEIVARPLQGLSYYGHTYKIGDYNEATGNIPVFVDESLFEIPTGFIVAAEPFLGFNPDGSFALAGYVQDNEYQMDFQEVKYYSPSGELLGTARQQPQLYYKDFNHHLAFGPDGAIYQLVSNPDHSIQIIRLGFFTDLPPKAGLPVASPTPMTALQLFSHAATAEEQALNALLSFFMNISTGHYERALEYFGGTVDEYTRPQMTGETVSEYWQYLCEYLWCLPVAGISAIEQDSADTFVFYVVFMDQDGTRFEISACCGGDPATTPPVWQFAYPVQKIDNEWKVMRGPLFTP